MSIDKFLDRQYNANTYNCAHFVCEVWAHLTSKSIEEFMYGFLLPVKDRFAEPSIRRNFKRLQKPVHLCIVLMRRPKTTPHVGIYYKNKVLQIERGGVSLLPLDVATLGFTKVSFYKC